ncbi:heterokaryon incompatibility protein-domain-containing protein [Fusarium solani]|uniref:Heterokaryon incompatibility protein-domain-containing protein n=1 Tax=Fusarium solani TaxID=169388 RepID=A0A9P9GZU8_FUSSL|nr:heterokaryon incompatibility protein-domain-containing protein [Fusarium solani]KAH7248470.1 heterokaryon incompatibility protein-domain-containing protein [Fusarium solani]
MAEKALSIDYNPFESSTEIRIFVLQRGSGTEPIQCTLCHIPRSQGRYHALSYEWGEESEDEPIITVNNGPVRIRRNLYEALKDVRESSRDLQLWVDAICINQASLKEKNQQVAKMGEIFGGAAMVLAWLGTAKDDSDIAMDWMADKTKLRRNLRGSDPDGPERKAIVTLCHRSYWRRVWIIQELYLSQSFEVRCGTKAIPFEVFKRSLGTLYALSVEGVVDREMAYSPAFEHVLSHATRRRDPAAFTLYRWLTMCAMNNFQSTREHDVVYGLLGISHDYQNGSIRIEVDYGKNPQDVYLDALRASPSNWSKSHNYVKLSRMMKLQMDESLKSSVFEILDKMNDDGLLVDDTLQDVAGTPEMN